MKRCHQNPNKPLITHTKRHRAPCVDTMQTLGSDVAKLLVPCTGGVCGGGGGGDFSNFCRLLSHRQLDRSLSTVIVHLGVLTDNYEFYGEQISGCLNKNCSLLLN